MVAPSKLSGSATLAAAVSAKRKRGAIAAALLAASGGGFWLYLRHVQELQAAQRRKLREQLRCC